MGLTLMCGAGLISALLGIGSGVLKIPAMDSALRLPIKVSSATSNFMIGVTAAASAGAYFARGEIATALAGPVALGSLAGAVLGARILMLVPNEKLRILFVIVLVALGIQMLLTAPRHTPQGDPMTGSLPKLSRLEILLAGLLYYGSWLASAAIAAGLAAAMIHSRAGKNDLAGWLNIRLATGGIAFLYSSADIACFADALRLFLRERDYRLALAALLVLAIVLAGIMVGLRTAGGPVG